MEAIENICVGILMIIFGIGVIIFMSKRPPSYPLTSVNISGYIAGVTFILLGIIYIFDEFHIW
ncbi:hypothetical protein [Flavobacterium sp.]|uniref:hypothetical protein n=1 Tax=Flavobacterium sp. TaxID=239 RepID=UPI000ED20690|nr:hypothetical protein [Flavobacterium sp.]HCQ12126.1 hypothetical protein [Flavobacterium sp.]